MLHKHSDFVNSASRDQYGAGALLSLIRNGESWTVADLVQSTGWARPTVTQRLDSLVGAGYVAHSDGTSTGGRPPKTFEFHRGGGTVVVADIGSSHAKVGVTDLGGKMLAESEQDLDVTKGPEVVLNWVADQSVRLLQEAGHDSSSVRGMGIGVPGPVEFGTGRLVSPPIMTGWDGFVVPDFFSDLFAGPVVVDKDANIMTLGEHRTVWPNHENIIMLKVGMGLGCGIVANGQIVRGAQGAAGDIGHIPRGDDIPCRCGHHGCVEATAGGWAIARDLNALGYDVRTSEAIVRLTRAGNRDAINLIRRSARIIGEVVADVIGMLNSSVVVVGGNLSGCREPLLAGIREVVYGRSQPLATRDLEVTYSRMMHEAGLVGASMMVRDEIFSPAVVNAATTEK